MICNENVFVVMVGVALRGRTLHAVSRLTGIHP
jgi:hypothetical protein